MWLGCCPSCERSAKAGKTLFSQYRIRRCWQCWPNRMSSLAKLRPQRELAGGRPPNLIICGHAPALSLAAFGRTSLVQVGTGPTCPPTVRRPGSSQPRTGDCDFRHRLRDLAVLPLPFGALSSSVSTLGEVRRPAITLHFRRPQYASPKRIRRSRDRVVGRDFGDARSEG